MRRGVKICGISDEAGLEAAAEAGADWIGLVFFERSPRCVTVETAARLHRMLAGRALAVGLFVDPDEAAVARVLDRVPLDILQLYAATETVSAIRSRSGRPAWRAIGVSSASELPCTDASDGLVIEAKPPAGADRPGGNGTRLDWSIVQGWQAPSPWMLAGGLTPDNVAEAIRQSAAPAVDVSSGVETAPGRKDPALIRRFVTAARSA